MPFTLSAFADEAGPTVAEQIKALQQAGIKHVDLRNVDGHNITALPVEHAKKVREQLDAGGITVLMYGSPLGKIDIGDDFNIDLEKLTHLGRLRPILGATAVRIFSYYNKGNRPHAEFQKEALGRLKKLKSLAGELGLVLYHENERHIFGDHPKDVLAIANELRDKNPIGGGTFKMIFDFGNYVVGKENVWEAWTLLRETTDAFHFKDNTRAPGVAEGHHVPVGQGLGQIPEIIVDAMHRNFSGPVTLEPHLQHSAAVLATGPGGVANRAYSKMTGNESFQIAAAAAKEVLEKAGAVVV